MDSNSTYFLLQLGGVLLFGAFVLYLEMRIVVSTGKGWDVKATRMVGLTLVVVVALCVVIVADSDARIAPVVGVLGSIAGYLFGRTTD